MPRTEEMADIEFRVKPHGILPDNQMVELWRGGTAEV